MPAEHYIDNKTKLIVTTWEGDAGDIELIEALKKYQKDIQAHPDYLDYNELIDFTNVTRIQITTAGIKNIGRIASKTDQNRTNRKLAIIVNSDLAFGLARMYEVYREFAGKTNKKIRSFKNRTDALKWVRNNTE